MQSDRVAARQRSQVETAKLVATFLTGVAATLCASALQVKGTRPLEVESLICLALAAALTIAVILCDRLREAPHKDILVRAGQLAWSQPETLRQLRTAVTDAVNANQRVVTLVQWVTRIQVLVALTSGTLATLSMELK